MIFTCKMRNAVKYHWPEYLIEAWCLGTFMMSACFFSASLFYPASPFATMPFAIRNLLMGVAMGATAIGIICSPWGKRSGAHFNPAVTLTFLRLGKIAKYDAAFYVLAHFVGGTAGVAISWMILGGLLSDGAVNFVATIPGSYGTAAAFFAEVIISFFMMTMILFTSNSAKLSRWTPYFAGFFVAAYIAVESPISGMSMNPARTFASGFVGNIWSGWWVYFAAPTVAMLGAAELYVRKRGIAAVICGKLHHHNRARCIFNCGYCEKQVIEVTKSPQMFPGVLGLF